MFRSQGHEVAIILSAWLARSSEIEELHYECLRAQLKVIHQKLNKKSKSHKRTTEVGALLTLQDHRHTKYWARIMQASKHIQQMDKLMKEIAEYVKLNEGVYEFLEWKGAITLTVEEGLLVALSCSVGKEIRIWDPYSQGYDAVNTWCSANMYDYCEMELSLKVNRNFKKVGNTHTMESEKKT